MATKTKFFRIAVEGQTATDGRTITEQMIREMVDTFNPDTYGVRINMEHLRGFSPEPPFNAYGDVLALRSQQDDIELDGKTERRWALYAQLDPTSELVEINRKRQKVYTSIEPQPNFAGTGKYGLVGLAVTDSPASLGTHRLKFSTKADDPVAAEIKADLDRRKSSKDSFFSAAYETRFELEAEASTSASAMDKFLEIFSAALGGKKEEPKTPPAQPAAPPENTTPSADGFAAAMLAMSQAIAADRKADQDANDRRFSALQDTLTTLNTTLTQQPANTYRQRPPAAGGAERQQASY